ncbi:MAG: c-type cytochrome biogenesis protein CcmI [Alphaproteobacteria bacterium]|nr:c-type cytochrome biogenesis protein CcmI [Alphaproteobacteria bacterium]
MIWLFLVSVAAMAFVLMTGGRQDSLAPDPLDHYKAQLGEIAEDEARGIIDPESAKAARLEVERRILKVAKGTKVQAVVDGDKRLSWLLAGLMVLAAIGLYAFMGRPDLPAKPGAVITGRDMPVQEGGPTYGEAISKVQAHLRDNPEDLQGLEVLAKSARAVRDFSVAANAFAELARLQPDDLSWRVQQFEAMMSMASGQITPAARLVLGQVLGKAPGHPAGQYYAGLARLQDGDTEGAKAIWLALADRSAPNAPWMSVLNNQLARLGVRPPALSDDQMAAVNDMSEEDRSAFIASMMERLANRLAMAPDDPEGWIMLARSHLSLGNREEAIGALERGIALVSEENIAPLQAFLDNLNTNPDL